MGVKTKIFAGFSVIALLLFVSGIIFIYEQTRTGRTLKMMLKDNLKSIEMTMRMQEAVHKAGNGVLALMSGHEKVGAASIAAAKRDFTTAFNIASQNRTVKGEDVLLNRVNSYFSSYFKSADSVVVSRLSYDTIWYTSSFLVLQQQLNTAIRQVSDINQRSMYINAEQVERGAYRSIIPGLIAIGVGIFFIVLFNYYLNLYFIQPILKITSGIENYLKHSIPFRVKVDTHDEVERLKSSVEKLIVQNRSNNPVE